MDYSKLISISAAIMLTSGVFVLVAPPAFGKVRPVVVVANPNIVIRQISFADLNLASASGELTLQRRVGGAVSSLCEEATGGRDGNYMTVLSAGKCRQSAWTQARPQIALATQRARDIASTGVSPIAAAAIMINLTK